MSFMSKKEHLCEWVGYLHSSIRSQVADQNLNFNTAKIDTSLVPLQLMMKY